MKNISVGAFILSALIHLAVTLFVIVALYGTFELDFRIYLFGINIPSLVYLVPLVFLSYFAQRKLSEARGFGRVLDLLISVPMLIAIVGVILLWLGIPSVESVANEIGSWANHVVSTEPTSYKVVVVLLFGLVSLLDVLGRDIGGVRLSRSRVFGKRLDDSIRTRIVPQFEIADQGEIIVGGEVIHVTLTDEHKRRIAQRIAGTPGLPKPPPVSAPAHGPTTSPP